MLCRRLFLAAYHDGGSDTERGGLEWAAKATAMCSTAAESCEIALVCRLFFSQGQIPNDVNEDTLKQLFSTYGLVTESKILMDKVAGKAKGCGQYRHTGAFTRLVPLAVMACLTGLQFLLSFCRLCDVR